LPRLETEKKSLCNQDLAPPRGALRGSFTDFHKATVAGSWNSVPLGAVGADEAAA